MPLIDLMSSPVTGVRAFNGLPVDALLWNEAHNQHHLHRRLHSLTSHRPGIVYGLEVTATGGQGAMVSPGVGIDSDGQVVVLSERITVTFQEGGQSYVVLSYEPMRDRNSAVAVDGAGEDYFRLIEGRKLQVTKQLPSGPHLELVRITRSGPDQPIREPKNAYDPDRDELNSLHRRVAFPHCYADVAIGEIGYIPTAAADPNAWKPNRAGLWNLVREGNGRGFVLEFIGPVPLARDPLPGVTEPTVLYIAGQGGFKPLSDVETERLSGLITNGATLFGEAVDGGAEFVKSFQQLAGKVSATLRPVEKGHPLLTAQYVFAVPPPGSQTKGEISASEDGGVILTSFDYGGAWKGHISGLTDAEASLSARERIRQAQEFGLNIVAHAAQRRRRIELARMR